MTRLFKAGANRRTSSPVGFGRGLLLTFLCLISPVVLTGCSRPPFLAQAMTPSYKPSNVFQAEPSLPASIRRIAMLPMGSLTDDSDSAFGRETLGPILLSELSRVRQFELVAVSADDLRLLSGRGVWNAEDKLPAEFFEKLRDKYGVDAVLFSRLTLYRAYEPLAIGWRLKLIDAEEPHILWAVDEVFDSRVPTVAAAAVRYSQDNPDAGASLLDSRSVMMSPRRFGEYTVNAVVQTIPGRTVAAK